MPGDQRTRRGIGGRKGPRHQTRKNKLASRALYPRLQPQAAASAAKRFETRDSRYFPDNYTVAGLSLIVTAAGNKDRIAAARNFVAATLTGKKIDGSTRGVLNSIGKSLKRKFLGEWVP